MDFVVLLQILCQVEEVTDNTRATTKAESQLGVFLCCDMHAPVKEAGGLVDCAIIEGVDQVRLLVLLKIGLQPVHHDVEQLLYTPQTPVSYTHLTLPTKA